MCQYDLKGNNELGEFPFFYSLLVMGLYAFAKKCASLLDTPERFSLSLSGGKVSIYNGMLVIFRLTGAANGRDNGRSSSSRVRNPSLE